MTPTHRYFLPVALALVLALTLTACIGADDPTATTATTTTTTPISSILAGIELGQRHVTLNGVDLTPLLGPFACDSLLEIDDDTTVQALMVARGVTPPDSRDDYGVFDTLIEYLDEAEQIEGVYSLRFFRSPMLGLILFVDPLQRERVDRRVEADIEALGVTGKIMPIVYPSRFEPAELEKLTESVRQVMTKATSNKVHVEYSMYTDRLHGWLEGKDQYSLADQDTIDKVRRAVKQAGLDKVVTICRMGVIVLD